MFRLFRAIFKLNLERCIYIYIYAPSIYTHIYIYKCCISVKDEISLTLIYKLSIRSCYNMKYNKTYEYINTCLPFVQHLLPDNGTLVDIVFIY
jgi:hypothetical protein